MKNMLRPPLRNLLIGDIVLLALVTAYGFASHNTLSSAGVRYFATFLPWAAAWLLFAPHFGAFDLELVHSPRHLWRPFLGMLLAAPFAAFLRAVWLQDDISPLFVVIMGGVASLAMLAWRGAYLWGARRGG